MPLNELFFGYVQWNYVPQELVERVEVARGGGYNFFGTYALGGGVNIITRLPEQTQMSGDLGYGPHDAFRVNGFGCGRITDGVRGAINGNIFDTDLPHSATCIGAAKCGNRSDGSDSTLNL